MGSRIASGLPIDNGKFQYSTSGRIEFFVVVGGRKETQNDYPEIKSAEHRSRFGRRHGLSKLNPSIVGETNQTEPKNQTRRRKPNPIRHAQLQITSRAANTDTKAILEKGQDQATNWGSTFPRNITQKNKNDIL